MDEAVHPDEPAFYETVRQYVIFGLFLICMYSICFYIVSRFRERHTEDEDGKQFAGPPFKGAEEDFAFSISMWMCTFTLSISLASVLLLPITIASNEILLLYPGTVYMEWLNERLIHGFWNSIFFCSNVSLFVFLPFTHFFTESEGFGSRKGVLGRFYEASLVLLLLGLALAGFTFVARAVVMPGVTDALSYLPFLYTTISLIGALVCLVCTPFGCLRMFSLGKVLVPIPGVAIDDAMARLHMEADHLRRLMAVDEAIVSPQRHVEGTPAVPSQSLSPTHRGSGHFAFPSVHSVTDHVSPRMERIANRRQSRLKRLAEIEREQETLTGHKTSPLQRQLVFAMYMLCNVALSVFLALQVVANLFKLLIATIGDRQYLRTGGSFVFGATSTSMFGSFGAIAEIALVLYFMAASVIGLYSTSVFGPIRPIKHRTSLHKIIINCMVLLILSSSLPVLSRVLGITDFDLMGNFGDFAWLGNPVMMLVYNAAFLVSTGVCALRLIHSLHLLSQRSAHAAHAKSEQEADAELDAMTAADGDLNGSFEGLSLHAQLADARLRDIGKPQAHVQTGS